MGGTVRARLGVFVLWLAAAFALSVPAAAQEKSGNKPGFTLAPGSARIVLMRPSIKVGEQSTGGMFEPNADWTAQARDNLARAFAETQASLGNTVVAYVEPVGAKPKEVAQYGELFSALADSVIEYQFFKGNRLPTKKRENSFEWSLGPEIGKLPGLEGADYALFVTTNDQFGSTGRKVLQVFAALARVPVTSGLHVGYAGLIDLRTGDLVWLNADKAMGGDVRTAEGAQKRVGQLLEGFPGRTAPATTTTAN